MRYPIISRSTTEELATQLIAGHDPAIGPSVTWVGTGDDVDLTALDDAIDLMRKAHDAFVKSEPAAKPEEFEGRAAGSLHRALRDLPIEALDEPGFWRYVSLEKLWWFISVREAGSIARGNVMKYVDGLHPAECVPMRMFLRAQAIRDGDDYTLASALTRSGDFWRSHVTRVRTGSAPPLARGFARLQAQVRMPTDDLRPFARRVNRLWTNVVLDRIDDAEADHLMQELHDSDRNEADVPDPTEADRG